MSKEYLPYSTSRQEDWEKARDSSPSRYQLTRAKLISLVVCGLCAITIAVEMVIYFFTSGGAGTWETIGMVGLPVIGIIGTAIVHEYEDHRLEADQSTQ